MQWNPVNICEHIVVNIRRKIKIELRVACEAVR